MISNKNEEGEIRINLLVSYFREDTHIFILKQKVWRNYY